MLVDDFGWGDAACNGNWKLFVKADGSGAELYDLGVEPKGDRNVAADKPEVVKRRAERGLTWRNELP
ncbi:hypothetical protein C1280_14145 [Gemmata obscuriglobus]|uniref:Uncharacterized protein n=1 Tax=Gemmata obscuriglobus TaxID=114 RepID=A0A2Z3HA70_9BACT|nr:hypothetical protein C1280_14145 [Gemmata obscuriglobus]